MMIVTSFFGVADDGTIIGVNEDINRKDSETLTERT